MNIELDMEYFQEKLFKALKIPKDVLNEPQFSGSAIAMQQTEKSFHEYQKAMMSALSKRLMSSYFPADPTAFPKKIDHDPEGSRIQNKGW